MKKKFEHKERKGLPGGPNEMFTYVTSVFDIYQAPSNIEGEGMFAGKPFKKGDLIGLAHSNGQPASQLGRMHNHDENSPTMISKKSGNDRFVFAAKDLQPGDELTTNYRMQPELEQPEDFQYGGSVMAPPRKGVRKNPDGSESTHLMATETFDGKNWFSFPTLFQDPDGTWIDMSDKPWQEAYEEAKRRGEVIEFGTDKEAAIKFGEGSWKTPKYQQRGEVPNSSNLYPVNAQGIPMDMLDEVTVTGDRFQEKWWSPANLLSFGLINGTKRRLTRNIHPFGYDGLDKITDALFYPDKPIDWPDSMLERNPELAGKTEADMKKESIQRQQAKVANDPSVPGSALMERQQLFQYMMGQDASQYEGIPLSGEGYGLRTSKYKPTNASNPNAYYFRSPATEYEIKDQFNNNQDIKDWMASQTKDKLLTNGAVLGNYHLTKGEDDKGKYVSYYDIWDLDPFKTGSSESGSGLDYDIPSEIPLIGGMQVNANTLNWLSNKFQQWGNVNPAELYGRVYYTENPDGTVNVLDKKQDGGSIYPVNAEGIPMGMLDEIVVKPSNFQTWWNKFRNLQKDNPIIEHFTNPLIAADNAIQILQIPSNLVRESIEGIGGKGDGEFNLGNIVPDIGGTTILDDTEAQVPVSQVLGVKDPKGAVGVDILTDPLTYVGGAGIGKNIIQKVGTRVAPKIIKPITNFGKLDKLPMYINDIPVSSNSDILVRQAIPGTVESVKGTVRGTPILTATGSNNNYVNFKKFLDPATNEQYYSFTESFLDNPLVAGRIFKMGEAMVPKGSILKQSPNGTLSQDSFNAMIRRLRDNKKYKDLTNYDGGYINLNEYAKGRNRLGDSFLTFTKNDLDALNTQYMDVFNNLGISEFRGLGSRQVPVLSFGPEYNPFQINSIRSIKDPRALQKYYNVSIPNITLQKLYQKGGEKTSWLDYANPFNWGVYTYDDAGTFGEAFAKAREEGQDQFMYYGDRYTTELAPTPEVKEEPKEEKLFYNKDILKGLSEEQVARRQSLLNAANAVAAAQGDDDNLRKLLVMSAVMENTLGADPKAYGRDYTRSPMSIDDVAYDDLFKIREGARGYTAQQKKNASWLEGLGINPSEIDSLLRADDPMAAMATARLVYGRAPEALPSGDDPDALYNYYLKYYNKGGVDKYGGAEAHRKKFNDYYNQIYREFGGETNQLKIYKDYVHGVYDGTEMEKSAEKIYDKLNRVYYKEAKKQGMRVPNYIMTNVIKQIDN